MISLAHFVWHAVGEEAKQRPGLQVNVYRRDIFFSFNVYSQLSHSDHFVNNRFVSQSNTVSKNSLVSVHYFNFLSDRDHSSGKKFDILFCFLFPVSDHPTWSLMFIRKSLLKRHKSLVLIALTRSADR